MEIGFQDSNSMNIFPFHGSAPDQDQYISGLLKARLLFIFNFPWQHLKLWQARSDGTTNYESESWRCMRKILVSKPIMEVKVGPKSNRRMLGDTSWKSLQPCKTLNVYQQNTSHARKVTLMERESQYTIYTPLCLSLGKKTTFFWGTQTYTIEWDPCQSMVRK